MRFLGIDPGNSGGVAILNEKGMIEVISPLIDRKWFVSFLKEQGFTGKKEHMVFLEKGQGMPGNGITAIYNYAHHNGSLEMALEMLKTPFELVAPQVWTRIIHAGSTAEKSKDKSRQVIQRLFPETDFRDPSKPKSIKIHEGIMDAVLIAEYGRRKWIKNER